MDLDRLDKALQQAYDTSIYSKCLRKSVGAVLFDPYVHSGHLIGLSSGYCGPDKTCKKCIKGRYTWKKDTCWSIHAEQRALYNYFSLFGYRSNLGHLTMAITYGPCDQCVKLLHHFQVPLIIYDEPYDNDYTKWEGKIKIIKRSEVNEFNLS